MIGKFPSSFASLTLVHMDGKSKDNRKLNHVTNESSEFLFTKVKPGKYRCKVRNSLGVLFEEDRWYGDENLAYVGHSVRKNTRDANEHKIVMLLSLDSSDMGLKGDDNFALGSSVEEKVDEIKQIGVVDNFKNRAESERIKFLEKILEEKLRLQGKMLMFGCYNIYNNKKHYATMSLFLFLPAVKYIWKKVQVPKLKVQKPVKYWEGRGARMKLKWKIMVVPYHPP
ncbi:unnamed protein product [Cuscuta europaea]|uniref:Uncharacterized protein n=1 Tax=Cuscuta europaea TaxID=41803 RepID=A0A9P0Z5K4_CUSEU|nr:unnamed protein product [Cuscuta europaea]